MRINRNPAVALSFTISCAFASCDRGPNIPSPKSDLSERIRCAEAGQKWFALTEPELKARGTFVTLSLPRFAYNRQMDTCLCSFGVIDTERSGASTMITRKCAVWDVLANRSLAEFISENGKVTSALSERAYNAKASQLMGAKDICTAPQNWAH